jgi:hypothetical protein
MWLLRIELEIWRCRISKDLSWSSSWVNLMRGRNREIVVEQGSCEGNRGAHEAGEVGREQGRS